MGMMCSLFGCEWVTIFSKPKSIISYSIANPERPDRESTRTLVIEECVRCRKKKAKLADTVGNCEAVDVDAAIHEMKINKKKTASKKTITVQVKDGNVVFSAEGLNLKPDTLEAKVYDDRIEIRRGD